MATQWAVPICKPRLLKEPKAQASYYADRYEQTYGLGPPRVSFEGSVVTQTQPQKDTKTQAKAASTNSQLSRPDNNANLPGPDNSKLHQEIAKLETQVSMLKAELAWLSGQWERLKVIKTLAPNQMLKRRRASHSISFPTKRVRPNLKEIENKTTSTAVIPAATRQEAAATSLRKQDLKIDTLTYRTDVTYRLALVLFQSFKHVHSPAKHAPTLVVGPNGTGKTESMRRIAAGFNDLFRRNHMEFDYVYINGQSHQRQPFVAFARALDSLPLSAPQHDEPACQSFLLQHHFQNHVLLVLDEIDSLDPVAVHLLLNMAQTKKGRRIVIVVISNNPQFAQSKLHEATVSRLGKSSITFPAYTAEQFAAILRVEMQRIFTGTQSEEIALLSQQAPVDDDRLQDMARTCAAKNMGIREALSHLGLVVAAESRPVHRSDRKEPSEALVPIASTVEQRAEETMPRFDTVSLQSHLAALPFYQTIVWKAMCKLHHDDQYLFGVKTTTTSQGYSFRLGRVKAKFLHLLQTIPEASTKNYHLDFDEAITALARAGLMQMIVSKSKEQEPMLHTAHMLDNLSCRALTSFFSLSPH